MRYFLLITFVMISWVANAEEILPTGCKAIKVNDETVMLSAPKPTLVMIHNISNTDLWVTHPVSEPSASAGWSSRLQAGNWSALAVQNKSFELSCIESKPGHEQQVSCANVLAVCQWSDVSMPQSQATYWAGEDMSLSALTAYLGRRGFELPEPRQ
ncbi:hypothetical protein [Legionella oakridgensis]|uniref:Enhanced entry protein EnhB n=2 Tax=Legionella oakridgensis TaxID=29423 RepID=W0BAN6_9GAMM|nr:hypothetical protein [Legionella oakridgensis]AHE65687.1 hypothetical protein Loa_00096 [Legionella oakridgensis ATCC 33761 = DSM 21215]ETO94500.1 hypothetical protein LOR_53c11400 [Legionella oakridgensis RV-2-2007]KTD38236.1 hypothetical protein Loak_1912 [Legionella oakridgensis]STY15634.1 Uncharacterised protein [Legionella longbeachae]